MNEINQEKERKMKVEQEMKQLQDKLTGVQNEFEGQKL